MKILSGIITYNPNIKRLEENIRAVVDQVDLVLVIDNASNNVQDIWNLLNDFSNISLIKNTGNLGVAHALNQEAIYGIKNSYEWLLSLDQDSVVPDGLIEEYKKYTEDDEIGMICCKIKDRNFGELDYAAKKTSGTEYAETCITSASLLKLSAWEKTGGYYEPFFIDSVDFDLCSSLIENGYKILRTNNVTLLHEVGQGTKVYVLGKDRQLTNHSPLRYYYIYRNGLKYGKRHHKFLRILRHCLFGFFLMNIFEKNRLEKDKMILKGIWHFVIGKYGKYEQ